MRWVVVLASLAVFSGPMQAHAVGDGLARVKRSGELRWGGDLQGGEPYVFEDPDRADVLVGFEVEVAEAIARQLGVRATFVQNDWSTLVPSLERGTFDVILNGLEVTSARQERIRFSRPYFIFAERLVARVGDRRIIDLASLRGLKVGTLASSLAWDLLGTVAADRVPYEGVEEPFVDLASGRTDAVVIDDIIVSRYGGRPGLAVVADVGVGEYAVGLRRQDESLARAIDEAVGALVASGELRGILARWRLDGPRQDALGRPRAAPAAGNAAGPPHRSGRLTGRQVVLFLQSASLTLFVSVSAMLFAAVGGLALAAARLPSRTGRRRALAAAATLYVEVFRGTPVLLQLYLIYFGLASILPLHPLLAAILGLGLNYAAYEAEIYRAGIEAVPRGQVEAAEALGMPGALVFRRVVLPQAFRVSLPGVANDFIALLKDSALVSAITVVELTKRMTIVAVDAGSWLVPGLLCAAIYFAMSYPLSRLARRLQARLGPRA